jgi:hypothetical protein
LKRDRAQSGLYLAQKKHLLPSSENIGMGSNSSEDEMRREKVDWQNLRRGGEKLQGNCFFTWIYLTIKNGFNLGRNSLQLSARYVAEPASSETSSPSSRYLPRYSSAERCTSAGTASQAPSASISTLAHAGSPTVRPTEHAKVTPHVLVNLLDFLG